MTPKRDSVVIAYCHPGAVRHEFMKSILDALSQDRYGLIAGCIDTVGLYVPQLRDTLVRTFLDLEREWLWFIDSDIMFRPNTLEQLLEHATRPGVFAGAYWSTFYDGINITWMQAGDDGQYWPVRALRVTDTIPELPAPIVLDACGMGMTLIHRDVLQAIAERHAEDPWKWFGHDIHADARLGEDVTFCRRAAAAGFDTVGVPVAVTHLKTVQIGPG